MRGGRQAGRRVPEGLPAVPRKGPAAAGQRRVAAGQGEVRQEARTGTRRRADGRGRCWPTPRPSSSASSATCTSSPASFGAATSRRSRCRPTTTQGRHATIAAGARRRGPGARQAGGPDARRAGDRGRDQAVHRRERHPAPARARPLPDHRDARVPAGQLDGLHELGPAARPEGRRASTPSARRPRTGTPQRVKSFLEEYNRHMLQILTIHEAYPGHYVQLEYANRNPSLIRRCWARACSSKAGPSTPSR